MTRRALIAFAAGLCWRSRLSAGCGLPAPALRPGRAAAALQPPDPHLGQDRASPARTATRSREDGRFAGIPPVASCAECHAEPQGQSADEKRLVEEYVKPGREIPWLVYARQPDNVRFPHAVHVEGRGDRLRALPRLARQRATRCAPTRRTASAATAATSGARRCRDSGAPRQGMKMSDCEGCHAARPLARPASPATARSTGGRCPSRDAISCSVSAAGRRGAADPRALEAARRRLDLVPAPPGAARSAERRGLLPAGGLHAVPGWLRAARALRGPRPSVGGRAEHPARRGGACALGLTLHHLAYHPLRLAEPALRQDGRLRADRGRAATAALVRGGRRAPAAPDSR